MMQCPRDTRVRQRGLERFFYSLKAFPVGRLCFIPKLVTVIQKKAPFGKGSCPRTGTEGLHNCLSEASIYYYSFFSLQSSVFNHTKSLPLGKAYIPFTSPIPLHRMIVLIVSGNSMG